MSWIDGYKLTFSSEVIQKVVPAEQSYSTSEFANFSEAINSLLDIGAISKCDPCPGQFVSSVFLTPKPNGKMRFILNLKMLNRFINTHHFKLEDLRTAIKLVTKDCFMTTLDLKDAYFSIKIHENSRKYLRFLFNNQLFEFNALPFGLNTAPYLFTKIMKPVVKLLRSAGFLSTLYLDDWLLLADTYENCKSNFEITKKLLCSLGFLINDDKSSLYPSKMCKFLGVFINSENLEISLPPDKKVRIKDEIRKFINMKNCKIRTFAQLVGILVSACPAVEYGWVHTKQFERCKFLNLKGDEDYNKQMILPNSLMPDFHWWLKVIDNSKHRIRDDNYSIEIYSDASTTGWGAACGSEKASGQWSNNERDKHINYLELLAAFIALKLFAKDLYDCQVLLRIDNSTAIAYINRMGGVQFPHLTSMSREIWKWCEERKLYIFASYIRSCDNTIADAESRRNHPDIEWELSDGAFNIIKCKFGQPDVDLFASRINKKCAKYVSWHRDPDAYAINAFTIDWGSSYFYAFPPFSVILKSLRKIINDNAKGILIAPLWPTQPWYPLYRSLLISDPIIFTPNENILISHSSNRQVHSTLTLVAGVLCGKRFHDDACRIHR